jgi:hypothetical protein
MLKECIIPNTSARYAVEATKLRFFKHWTRIGHPSRRKASQLKSSETLVRIYRLDNQRASVWAEVWYVQTQPLIQCPCSDEVGSLDDSIQRVLQMRRKCRQYQSALVKNTVTRDHIRIHLFDDSRKSWILPQRCRSAFSTNSLYTVRYRVPWKAVKIEIFVHHSYNVWCLLCLFQRFT